MDEEKKKYLDELKSQIDPEILKRMAAHLGKEGDDSAAAFSALSSGNNSSEESGTPKSRTVFPASPAEKIRDRRASAFQERVAQKKRQDMVAVSEKKDEVRRRLIIYSHNEFWSRIAESQFRNLGFQETESYYDFEGLVRALLEGISQHDGTHTLAVSMVRLTNFLKSWYRLLEQMKEQGKEALLNPVEYIVVVESVKQVPEELMPIVTSERVLTLTDEAHENRDKVRVLLNRSTNNM